MRLLAGLCTLAGAVFAVLGMLRPWTDGQDASELAIAGLFGGEAGSAGYFDSVAFLLLLAVVAAVAGLLARSRTVLGLGLLLCLVPTVMWAVTRLEGLALPGLASGYTSTVVATGAFLLATLLLPRR
ncbi:hypothetical protein SAMN05421810_102420 [Amycolatopsis arida]|uniref:Uncharacterized protein n=1 Tax=Amycolatopsis arida TaxID=587909 RepID=A0A1I5PWQ4_9PSEU|nr:hypothetical protein [Amycolatopsis arida]TDX98627.1 hypothetical protein CLV69_101420 [Amycolatopsis arida]SFP38260.1 hypothetical protein SAMN05421810_102420 [Amycolatopsis arida]